MLVRHPGTGTTYREPISGFDLRLSMSLVVQLLLILAVSCPTVLAAEPSVTGLWRTIDDSTGKPRGLVHITEVSGQYQGRLEKTFPQPGEDPNPKCDKCGGSRRNQPVIGVTILWGMTKQGEEYQAAKFWIQRTVRSTGLI